MVAAGKGSTGEPARTLPIRNTLSGGEDLKGEKGFNYAMVEPKKS